MPFPAVFKILAAYCGKLIYAKSHQFPDPAALGPNCISVRGHRNFISTASASPARQKCRPHHHVSCSLPCATTLPHGPHAATKSSLRFPRAWTAPSAPHCSCNPATRPKTSIPSIFKTGLPHNTLLHHHQNWAPMENLSPPQLPYARSQNA
jgi:hypothetical protein